MLAKSKLNSIETLMSQALIDLDMSHEEFKIIVFKFLFVYRKWLKLMLKHLLKTAFIQKHN